MDPQSVIFLNFFQNLFNKSEKKSEKKGIEDKRKTTKNTFWLE